MNSASYIIHSVIQHSAASQGHEDCSHGTSVLIEEGRQGIALCASLIPKAVEHNTAG